MLRVRRCVAVLVVGSILSGVAAPSRAASIADISNDVGAMNAENQTYINSRLPGLMPYYGPKYSCTPQGSSTPITSPSAETAPATWPDGGTVYEIWEAEPGFPDDIPQGQTIQLQYVYDNTAGAPLEVTIYATADDIETTYVNGVQVTHNDSARVLSTGTVTLNVGQNTITANAENLIPDCSGAGPDCENPAGYQFEMVDGAGDVLLTSNSNWQVVTGQKGTLVQTCADVDPSGTATSGTGSIIPDWNGPQAQVDSVSLTGYIQAGWANSFPDPNAQVLSPSPANFPVGYMAEYGYTYDNDSGSNISGTLYFFADDSGVVSINGEPVETYSEGNGAPVAVVLPPGLDQIVIENTNSVGNSPMGAALTIVGPSGNVVVDTNTAWKLLGTGNS